MSSVFLNEPLDNLLHQAVMPGNNPSIEDTNTASIVRLFSFVYLLIEKCRKEIELGKPIAYGNPSSQLEIQSLIWLVKSDKRPILSKYAALIAEKLYLSDRWVFPFEIAILTHCLPVPEDPLIALYPMISSDTPQNIKKLLRYDLTQNTGVLINVLRQPNTLHELYMELEANNLTKLLEQLPKRPTSNMKADTLVWGRAAAIWRSQFPKKPNWPKVLESLERIEPLLKEKNKRLPPLPDTPQELIKLMQNFRKSVKSNYPYDTV